MLDDAKIEALEERLARDLCAADGADPDAKIISQADLAGVPRTAKGHVIISSARYKPSPGWAPYWHAAHVLIEKGWRPIDA